MLLSICVDSTIKQESERGSKIMKKEILKVTGKVIHAAAMVMVKAEVNSTCPFAVYQPKLPESVEKMRKNSHRRR